MKIEYLISEMKSINVYARIWHWTTESAQHHTTFEQFLTQNETLTDSLVESILGNDVKLSFREIAVKDVSVPEYSLETARAQLNGYRSRVLEQKKALEKAGLPGAEEFITILDDVTELVSKTLYLLKLK